MALSKTGKRQTNLRKAGLLIYKVDHFLKLLSAGVLRFYVYKIKLKKHVCNSREIHNLLSSQSPSGNKLKI